MKRILALLAPMTAVSFMHARQDAKFHYDRGYTYRNKKKYDKASAGCYHTRYGGGVNNLLGGKE
jgi:hypothetical protein